MQNGRDSWLLGFASMLVVAGCGDDGDGGGSGQSIAALCAKGCETGMTLNCPNEPSDCAAECESDAMQLSHCETQVRAYASCATNRPASDWECDEQGEANVKGSVCTAERVALLQCAVGGAAGNGGS